MILADPRHEPKVRQGVTTEMIGVDGLSYAPLPGQADLDALIEMNAGLDGAPDIGADWQTVVRATWIGSTARWRSISAC